VKTLQNQVAIYLKKTTKTKPALESVHFLLRKLKKKNLSGFNFCTKIESSPSGVGSAASCIAEGAPGSGCCCRSDNTCGQKRWQHSGKARKNKIILIFWPPALGRPGPAAGKRGRAALPARPARPARFAPSLPHHRAHDIPIGCRGDAGSGGDPVPRDPSDGGRIAAGSDPLASNQCRPVWRWRVLGTGKERERSGWWQRVPRRGENRHRGAGKPLPSASQHHSDGGEHPSSKVTLG